MKQLTVRGLSLTRPWPFAFLNGPEEERKGAENRSWKPPSHLIGHYIALHAAKSWDEGDREQIARLMGVYVPSESESPKSEIFMVCRLIGYVERKDDPRLIAKQRKWFIGPFCWLLDERVALKTPVRCSGAQGLWTFDSKPTELAALREAYREAIVEQGE